MNVALDLTLVRLTAADLETHARLGITPDLLHAAGVRRVTDAEARSVLTSRHPGNLQGLCYPYVDPVTGRVLTYRVRRDHPEIEDGKPVDKYLSASGDRRRLYFRAGSRRPSRQHRRHRCSRRGRKERAGGNGGGVRAGRSLLVTGTGGCWGWRGRIGKTIDANGNRVDEKGPLPDLDRIVWTGRDVVIVFDANAASNASVQAARRALARELAARGATVRIADLPVEDGVNGPDDFIAAHGDPADPSGDRRGKDERPTVAPRSD